MGPVLINNNSVVCAYVTLPSTWCLFDTSRFRTVYSWHTNEAGIYSQEAFIKIKMRVYLKYLLKRNTEFGILKALFLFLFWFQFYS